MLISCHAVISRYLVMLVELLIMYLRQMTYKYIAREETVVSALWNYGVKPPKILNLDFVVTSLPILKNSNATTVALM